MTEYKINKNEWGFLLVCLGLAILAEWSFFHGTIGVSYLVFITGFYLIFFIRFRKVTFTHRRIGLLFMLSIWLLSASYVLYDNEFFYFLNNLVIPGLVLTHIVLVTSVKEVEWHRPKFIQLLMEKCHLAISHNFRFVNRFFKTIFKQMDEKTAHIVKRIMLGLLIGLPILGVVTSLLMEADAVFESLIGTIPDFILQFSFQEQIIRTLIVLFFLFIFFGIFQVLTKPRRSVKSLTEEKVDPTEFDGVICLTILILLNGVYLLFSVVQFTYFFGNGLMEGYTYAEYARKGFFELVVVTLINWTILITCLSIVKTTSNKLNVTLKLMYSILVLVSSVMLTSAYQRLSLYESAYGFTLDRILAHSFMLFLLVIFAYTFIRIWLEKLSLLHFYAITSLLFYTTLNVVPLEQIIVENNIERYQDTGKIDIHYLERLSYTGIDGLIDLYEEEPNYLDLKEILAHHKQEAERREVNLQSFNISKQRVTERLLESDIE